jgi:hypothetical protein
MKTLLRILFVFTVVIAFNCKKDVESGEIPERGELVKFELRVRTDTSIQQRGSQGFNGAVSRYQGIVLSFETKFNRTKSDCEVFGDYAGVQVMIRKEGGASLDYYLGRNVIPLNGGYATMYRINVFRWYWHHNNRWRVSVNGTDIAEFDGNENYEYAHVGFGMCQSGTIKETIWQPAFVFNGVWTDNIGHIWQGRGVIRIYLSENKVVATER